MASYGFPCEGCGSRDCDGCQEDEPIDAEDMSFLCTPEGEELEPYTLEDELEDLRAKADADAAWLRKVRERRAA